jgi:ribosome-binding protein aMBF1 (putative translation factor)
LAITQRTIHVTRPYIAAIRHHRKKVTATPKTLGDHIHIKRYEKRLSLRQLAAMMGLAVTAVKSFEGDSELPNECEWQSLQKLLGLDPRLKPTKPNSCMDVGNLHLVNLTV